jgi:hypothetical protein
MQKQELNRIKKWHTKLKPKQVKPDDPFFIMTMKEEWIVTEFVHVLHDDQLRYLVQPLESNGMYEGVTGLWAYVLTEDEMLKYFDIKEEPSFDEVLGLHGFENIEEIRNKTKSLPEGIQKSVIKD